MLLVAKTITDKVKELGEQGHITCTAPTCGRQLNAYNAYVGDRLNLYLALLGSPEDESRPLNAVELVSQARCAADPLDAGIDPERPGRRLFVKMYPLLTNARTMDYWTENNAKALALQQHRATILQRRERDSARAASKQRGTQRLGFVAKTFAEMKPSAPPKPGRQKHFHKNIPKAPRPANAPKKFGDERKPDALAPKRVKKGKKNSDEGNGKKH